MVDDAFGRYLSERGMNARTVGSRISNCRRVERAEGALDEHYRKDHLEGILARLTYTTEDGRQSRTPKHQIEITGDVRNGTATLKSAVALYREFRTNNGRVAKRLFTPKRSPSITRRQQRSGPNGRSQARTPSSNSPRLSLRWSGS